MSKGAARRVAVPHLPLLGWRVTMGDIGEELTEIELEPLPEDTPAAAPAEAPVEPAAEPVPG